MGAGFAWFQNTDVSMSRTLDKEDEAPFQMVRVDAGSYAPDFLGLRHLERVELDTYWVDRYEVTNEQYKAFYDAGAYREKKYWKHELIKDGRALTWDEAMTELVDAAGRPGPSTWELGDYPEGQELPGDRCELVRGGRLCGVRRQATAILVSLGQGGRHLA